MNLTKKQLEVVDFDNGSLLVTAGPGSGKTRVLIERIARVVQSKDARVVALTFSNKAAEEILDRLQLKLSVEELSNVSVGTIHSFCLDVVLTRGKMIGLPSNLSLIENDKDKIELLKRVLLEFEPILDRKKDIQDLLNGISKYKQQRFLPTFGDMEQEQNKSFQDIFDAYNNLLIENHLIDYDDILFFAFRILTEKPQIVKLYSQLYDYVCIDEAQDLNFSQYSIIKVLCSGYNNLMMIGDENQSIYGFNGSDSRYMTNFFVKDFTPCILKLNENFRSTKKIIQAARSLIKTNVDNIVYPLMGDVIIKKFMNHYFEADWVANQILYEVKEGNEWIEGDVEFSKIAVIARNRYILEPLEEIFKTKNIPYNFKIPNKPLESLTSESEIFENGIKLIVNPNDQITKEKLEIIFEESDSEFFIDVLKRGKLKKDSDLNLEILIAIQSAWNAIILDNSRFSYEVKNIVKKAKTVVLDVDSDEFLWKERFINDMNIWIDHWNKYCKLTVPDQRNLYHFKHQISLGRTANYSSEGVTLSTVHMTKGLEYDMVFIIGLCEGVFPDYRAKSKEALSEEFNNMFVAITRSKRVCYLTYPESRKMPWGDIRSQKPSLFLKKIHDAIS